MIFLTKIVNLIEDFEVDIQQNYGNGTSFEVELTDIGLDHYKVREIVSEVLDANLDTLEEKSEEEKVEETVED